MLTRWSYVHWCDTFSDGTSGSSLVTVGWLFMQLGFSTWPQRQECSSYITLAEEEPLVKHTRTFSTVSVVCTSDVDVL